MASPPEDLRQRAAALVQQLRSGSDSQQGAAANELWRMAQEAPGAEAAVAAGAVEALLLLLRSPAHTSGGGDAGSGSSVSPECAALAALDNLLVECPASNDLMAAAGGIELCVRLVQQRPGSLAQAYALSALCGTSSYHAGNTATIAAAGIIPAVVLALGGSDSWAQANAAGLLAHLMYTSDCIQTARGAGAIPALLRCLKTPQPSNNAVIALGNMAADPACMVAITAWLQTVVACLRNGSPAAQQSAAALLAGFCLTNRPEFVAAMEKEGATSALMHLLDSSSLEVMEVTICALRHLSGSPACCSAMLAAGAAQALMASLATDQDPAVMAALCLIEANLMLHGEQAWLTVASQQAQAGQPGANVAAAGGVVTADAEAPEQTLRQEPAQPPRPRPPHACAAEGCGAAGRLRLCGGCRSVRYCSEACCRAHWKAHKADCRRIQAERAAALAGAVEEEGQPHGTGAAEQQAEAGQQDGLM